MENAGGSKEECVLVTSFIILGPRFIVHRGISAWLYMSESALVWIPRRTNKYFLHDIFSCSAIMSQAGQEDEQMQRPEVREAELAEAKTKLGTSGSAKSKTFEVMEECEKIGKAAPSIFSRGRSGGETAFNVRSTQPTKK